VRRDCGGYVNPCSWRAPVCITGTAPCTFAPRLGNFLPAGMTFDANGTLSGTLTEAGNFVVNFVLTDAADKTLRSGRSFEVFPAEGRSDQTVWEAARSYKVGSATPSATLTGTPTVPGDYSLL
jgi:hypothetical protein